MVEPEVSSSDGSTAIGRDNNAPVANINAGAGANVSVQFEQQAARELPSFLGSVIGLFSQQGLAQYALGDRRALPPEVVEKINYNNFPRDHRVLAEYLQYGLVLDRTYHGVEQQNPDARYLVRRRAGVAYKYQLGEACKIASISEAEKITFARNNAAMLVEAVIAQLMREYASSQAIHVVQEIAHLAVSLIVADAVVECEVLERQQDAIAS